jgi:hypothetical protein
MGLLSGLIKAGVAQKVISEARKPHNQQKIKNLIASAQNRSKGGRPPR